MPLAPGVRLGAYEVVALIGAGGRGSALEERLRPCRRHQRQFALGVGPQRQWKNIDPEPMPITTGSRLGPYEIVALIGVGGMDI